jgi:hypothetical protein
MQHRKTARLAAWQVRLLVWSGLALWLSGAVWLGLHYFGEVEGEFGTEPNPLEPWMLKAHGAAMIPALLGLGGLFVVHISKGWAHREQRVAGLVLSAFLVLLVASGWLLYYGGAEGLRESTSVAHWVLGLAAPAAFVWHYANGKRLRSPARRRPAPTPRDTSRSRAAARSGSA